MAEFGWAYIECSSSSGAGGGQAAGPTGSIQFLTGSNSTNGVSQLLFLTSSNTMVLTGTLDVSGTINANFMNINVTNKNVINLSASGDTKFGDTLDDTHQFTGSLHITGAMYYTYKRVTTNYTIGNSDYIVGVSASSGVTIRLPSASVNTTGRIITIKDEYVFTGGRDETPAEQIAVSASAASSDLIDGNGYVAIAGDNASISLYSSGDGKWFII